MTQATAAQTNRDQEIRAIHIAYADFYRIGGGLFIILSLAMIGSWVFGQNQLSLADNMLGYVTNVATEALSVVATIIVIDQLNRRRETQERKLALFRQAKSRSNDAAVEALDQIVHEDWWGELMAHYPSENEKYKVDLSSVQWAGGIQLKELDLQDAYLRDANLQNADLVDANLQNAYLVYSNLQSANLGSANLQSANLGSANLQNAKLVYSNLRKAYLMSANLQGAKLMFANLQSAILWGAKFDEKTVLPDAEFQRLDEEFNPIYDKYWTAETNMSRYTDPEHPDFWQPDWAKEQGE